jgi:GTPase involved in cell partitioning and DNA repair
MRFKSAINRAPRQKTPGWPGEKKVSNSNSRCWRTLVY